MRVETYKCDVCGKVKGEANHWLLAGVSGPRNRIWGIRDWDSETAARPESIHLCGSKCAHAALDKHLSRLHTGNSQTNGIDNGQPVV